MNEALENAKAYLESARANWGNDGWDHRELCAAMAIASATIVQAQEAIKQTALLEKIADALYIVHSTNGETFSVAQLLSWIEINTA